MAKNDKDILTTAQTAKLIGVSTRTAQLLIESGTLPSWKTPGGHRRVYRADVMAIIPGDQSRRPAHVSAMIVAIAAQGRLPVYERLFGAVEGFTIRAFDDVSAAMIAVGTLQPHAVVVDCEPGGEDRTALLHALVESSALADTRIIAVGPAAEIAGGLEPGVVGVAAPEAAVAAIRSALVPVAEAVEAQIAPGVPTAPNEAARLRAMERTGLLDTPPEDAFDRLTWLATELLDVPISLMTLLTASKQWFKSRVGLDMTETPRSWAFCNQTIMQRGVFAVDDLARDERFAANPAVAGDPGFRFYAGAPILDEDGFAIGSLCVIDSAPRTLDARGERILKELAAIASDELRLRSLSRRARPATPGLFPPGARDSGSEAMAAGS